MLHDPRDVKIMVEETKSSPPLGVLRLGRPIVHQNIVGARHVVPFEKDEPARDVTEILRVNPIDYVHTARRTELQQDGSDRLHVLHFPQLVADLDRHGRAAERQKNGRRRRLQHYIRADAFNSLGRLLQQAAGEPHDQDYERYLDTNSDHTHNCPNRPSSNIVCDQLPNHGRVPACSSPTCTSSVPGGWVSSNRSAEISSFTVSFRMRSSSL